MRSDRRTLGPFVSIRKQHAYTNNYFARKPSVFFARFAACTKSILSTGLVSIRIIASTSAQKVFGVGFSSSAGKPLVESQISDCTMSNVIFGKFTLKTNCIVPFQMEQCEPLLELCVLTFGHNGRRKIVSPIPWLAHYCLAPLLTVLPGSQSPLSTVEFAHHYNLHTHTGLIIKNANSIE